MEGGGEQDAVKSRSRGASSTRSHGIRRMHVERVAVGFRGSMGELVLPLTTIYMYDNFEDASRRA